MSIQIIVHRGYKNVWYDNNMVGILLSVFKKKFTEFDILYTNGKWKVCHDFDSLTFFTSNLEDLLAIFRKHIHLIRNPIIIDFKWDFVKNRNDDMKGAIQILKSLLCGLETVPLWVQAPNPMVLDMFLVSNFDIHWNLGMIIYNMDEFHKYKEVLYYVMVSLTGFPCDEIKAMSEECHVMGYTCKDITRLHSYHHLFHYVKGIVCDVCL